MPSPNLHRAAVSSPSAQAIRRVAALSSPLHLCLIVIAQPSHCRCATVTASVITPLPSHHRRRLIVVCRLSSSRRLLIVIALPTHRHRATVSQWSRRGAASSLKRRPDACSCWLTVVSTTSSLVACWQSRQMQSLVFFLQQSHTLTHAVPLCCRNALRAQLPPTAPPRPHPYHMGIVGGRGPRTSQASLHCCGIGAHHRRRTAISSFFHCPPITIMQPLHRHHHCHRAALTYSLSLSRCHGVVSSSLRCLSLPPHCHRAAASSSLRYSLIVIAPPPHRHRAATSSSSSCCLLAIALQPHRHRAARPPHRRRATAAPPLQHCAALPTSLSSCRPLIVIAPRPPHRMPHRHCAASWSL